MKWFSTDHLKFVYVDSRHNLFHWLTVVFIRIIISLIFVPLSFYLIAVGFSFSAETIQPFLPVVWFEKISHYSAQLPYFPSIKQFVFAQLNQWYQKAPVWWTMAVGIPLILMGISLFLINFFNLYYSIFSQTYNRTHCPLCKEPIKARMK